MGYELDKVMKQYGVTTPSIAPYAGATPTAVPAALTISAPVAPVATHPSGLHGFFNASPLFSMREGLAQAPIPGFLGMLQNVFKRALPTSYSTQKADYDKKVADYQNQLALSQKSVADQGVYNQYKTDYQNRIANTPMYAQSQFGVAAPVAPPALAAPVYASEGGSVKHLADKYGFQHYEVGDLAVKDSSAEDTVDATDLSLTPTAGPAAPNTAPYAMTPQIQEVMQRNRAQEEEFNKMMQQSLNSPEMSKVGDSEKYLRLASAFLSPTRTGAFTENLGLAGAQMAEINKSQREAALSSLKLKLAAQKLRVDAGKEELNALARINPTATPGQKITQTLGEKRLAADELEYQRKVAKDAADEAQRQKDNAWKYSPSGDLDPKEVRKLDALYPKAVTAVKTFNNTSDTLIKDIDSLIQNPGLDKITGFIMGRGWMPHIDADANKAKSTYDKILARGQFGELAKIRAASTTGGGLGNISDAEGQTLKAAFGALDRAQTAEDVRKELMAIREQILSSKANIADEFTNTYTYRADRPAQAATTAAPATTPNAQSLVDYYKSKKKP